MTTSARSVELRALAQRIADEVSDIELLVVTRSEPALDACFSHAADCGLTSRGTWGPQGGRPSVCQVSAPAGRADLVVAHAGGVGDRLGVRRRGLRDR